MPFCTKCGASIDNNTKVCPNCGAPQQTTANNSNTYVNPAPVSMDGTDYTSTMDPNDIAQNKAMAVLSYLGILFLIPILSAPNSPYARFHSNQGIILYIRRCRRCFECYSFCWKYFFRSIRSFDFCIYDFRYC